FMDDTTFTGGSYFTPDHVDPSWVLVGTSDFSGDGRTDLLFQHQDHGAVVLMVLDGLTRLGEQTIPIAPNTPWRIAATADFNSDGHADILWQHEALGQLYVWFMKPTNGWAGHAG